MRYWSYILFTVISVFAIHSCNRPPEYSNIPYISFNRFQDFPSNDSLRVFIDFKDGDGNLGTNNKDSGGVWENCPKNYLIDWWVKKDGEFKKITSFSTDDPDFNFNGNFPVLNPEGKKMPLEGTIRITLPMMIVPTATPPLLGNDTLKFSIYIKDRECNSSNIIETPPIVVNPIPIF